ncbi:hypothetical protein FRC12_019200 [Ceratobasidium sp. 428]|nr:hypothetical protein FRC12_019200 [Ceratobasidium sp. 428]
MPPKRIYSILSGHKIRFSPLRAVRTLRSSYHEAFTSLNAFVRQLRPAEENTRYVTTSTHLVRTATKRRTISILPAIPGTWEPEWEPDLAPQHAINKASSSQHDTTLPALADPNLDEEVVVDNAIAIEHSEEDATTTHLAAGATSRDSTSDVRDHTPYIAGPSQNLVARGKPSGTVAAAALPARSDSVLTFSSDGSIIISPAKPNAGASSDNPAITPGKDHEVISLSSTSTISFDEREPEQVYLPRYGTMRSQWSYGSDGLFNAPNPEQCFVGDVYFSPQGDTLKYWVCVARDAEGGEDGEIVQEWLPVEIHGLHPTTPEVTLEQNDNGVPYWFG